MTGISVSATLVVHSSACITVDALTVAVRGSGGAQFDFPGAVSSVQICPSGFTLNTGARTFPTGNYTAFGAYLISGVWTGFPSQAFNVGAGGTTTAPSWDSAGSYTQVRNDEFTSSTFDTTFWEKGWFPSSPTQVTLPVNTLEQACYNPSYVTQPGDGLLHFKLNHVTSTCGSGASLRTMPNTASLITSRGKVQRVGGNFEARVFLPSNAANQAVGWPSWWMNGVDPPLWPAHGEIDILEGLAGATKGYLHYDNGSGGDANQGWSSASPFVGWHNVGAKWASTGATKTVTWFWDGVAMNSLSFPATTLEYFVLGYTISNSSATPAFPSEMLVDWVRIWQ